MPTTNADRILTLLGDQPGLDDDEITRLTGIKPRQQVNQICRRLEREGRLARRATASGKIGNYPTGSAPAVPAPVTSRPQSRSEVPSGRPECSESTSAFDLKDLRRTLILIPCSGAKSTAVASYQACPPITAELPPVLAERLAQARHPVLARAGLDERSPMAAWRRYTGTLYVAAHEALTEAIRQRAHVLVLSGGYGALKACEPIGHYSTRLRLKDWPPGLLEEVLTAYAKRHGLSTMRAFVSATTDYCRVIYRTPWREAGINDAVVFTPAPTTGAMVKAPRAQGEALASYLGGELRPGWRSSDDLEIECVRL